MSHYDLKNTKSPNRIKVDTKDLSREEGDVIVKAVKGIVDLIVMLTGGKPTFGKK